MTRLIGVTIVCLLVLASMGAQAGIYKFTPGDADLDELPHEKYFTWGLQWTAPATETIQSATLTYKRIWDWTTESDHLYTHLLNTVNASDSSWVAKSGYKTVTITKTDNQRGGDNFSGQGYLVGTWSDPKGGRNGKYAQNVSYDIPSSYYSWLTDGNLGFGIDPDCHYYNSGVELEIVTGSPSSPPVPEASTLMLACLGSMSLGGLRFLRRK